mmetsp:Transcript_53282/g.87582  ORF Transcript_53282/g.87582 Transcript_53282/m.87582 type:complete len:224 (+) Transcript_53282:2005-2676(+)
MPSTIHDNNTRIRALCAGRHPPPAHQTNRPATGLAPRACGTTRARARPLTAVRALPLVGMEHGSPRAPWCARVQAGARIEHRRAVCMSLLGHVHAHARRSGTEMNCACPTPAECLRAYLPGLSAMKPTANRQKLPKPRPQRSACQTSNCHRLTASPTLQTAQKAQHSPRKQRQTLSPETCGSQRRGWWGISLASASSKYCSADRPISRRRTPESLSHRNARYL